MSNFVSHRTHRAAFALTFLFVGLAARGEENLDPSCGLLGTRYFDVGMGRSEQHHSWQHTNTTEASINWPLFSHLDLGVAYQHTELKPPWRELATVYASTGLYGGNTPPPSAPFSTGNGGQPVLDPTSTSLTNVTGDTSVLIGNQPINRQPEQPQSDELTIQPKADSARITLAWYVRRPNWTPFARVSLARDFISYDERLSTVHTKSRVQHDGYMVSVGTELPFRRVLITAAFSYADLIHKPDLPNQDTSSYGFSVDANLWFNNRLAGFANIGISDAKLNASYTWSCGTGIRIRL